MTIRKAKKGRRLFEDIRDGLNEAIEYSKGNIQGAKVHKIKIPNIDVAKARKELGLSQSKFAEEFGFPLSTLKKWEQGDRQPERSASILLAVISQQPDIVRKIIAQYRV